MITTFTYYKQILKNLKSKPSPLPLCWSSELFTIRYYNENEFNKLFKDKLDLKIEKGAKLYFTSDSKFSREKISNSEYKKCIKIEKADYIIIPNKIETFHNNINFIKLYNGNCAFSGLTINGDYFDFERFKTLYPTVLGDKSLQSIGEGLLSLQNENLEEQIRYGIENNIPIITDRDLDKIFQSKLSQLTSDELVNIYDMLISSDSSTIQLGIKLLNSYNLIGYENAITILFESLPKNCYNVVKNLAAFKCIKSTINYFNLFSNRFPQYKLIDCSENEKQLIKPIVKRLLIKNIEEYMNALMKRPAVKIYNFKLSLTLNE